MKGKGLPPGKRVKGMVTTVDLVPTILDYLGISTDVQFEGHSLRSCIDSGSSCCPTSYSEMLDMSANYDDTGQCVRTQSYKYVRYLAKMVEEFYDLERDPGERNNIIESMRTFGPKTLRELRRTVNNRLLSYGKAGPVYTEHEREQVENRLRALGYRE